jgi:DNA-binding transcriptional ArsR family regulator
MRERNVALGSLFAVLADPTRREVVAILGDGPRRAGQLAAMSGVTPSAMSKHLRTLLDAGIVDDERPAEDARVREFHLRPEALIPLQGWLDQLQTQWGERLDDFKRHVESEEQYDE